MANNPDINVTVSESGAEMVLKIGEQTCDVAAMSRPMKNSEFSAAANKGIQPVAHVVALDGLTILVHPSNR